MHSHEDELFYVLKDRYEFYVGDSMIKASKGDLEQLPRRIPHVAGILLSQRMCI